MFVSDIERLFYLTGVKFEHQSRIRELQLEVIKLHEEGVFKSQKIADLESKLEIAKVQIEDLKLELTSSNQIIGRL